MGSASRALDRAAAQNRSICRDIDRVGRRVSLSFGLASGRFSAPRAVSAQYEFFVSIDGVESAGHPSRVFACDPSRQTAATSAAWWSPSPLGWTGFRPTLVRRCARVGLRTARFTPSAARDFKGRFVMRVCSAGGPSAGSSRIHFGDRISKNLQPGNAEIGQPRIRATRALRALQPGPKGSGRALRTRECILLLTGPQLRAGRRSAQAEGFAHRDS